MTSPVPSSFLVDRNIEHLKLLALYQFVVAILVAVLWVVFYVLPLVLGPAYYRFLHLPMTLSPDTLRVQLFSGLLVYGAQVAVLGLNGWSLRQRKHWLSCVILSCIECLCAPPLGLILGISAVLVLRRESVKTLFSAPPKAAAKT